MIHTRKDVSSDEYIGYLLSIKQVIVFRFSHLLLEMKLMFSASGIVQLIHNWELTFRILSCLYFFIIIVFFFCFCLLNPLQTFKPKYRGVQYFNVIAINHAHLCITNKKCFYR